MTKQSHKYPEDLSTLKDDIVQWGSALGFQQVGISDVNLGEAEERLGEWLQAKFHGNMDYMQRHGTKRSRPGELVEGTIRVISVRMDYLSQSQEEAIDQLDHASKSYISRYALGRDYHKVLRGRLRALARQMEARIGWRKW